MSASVVLIAEDDAGIRTILVRALRGAGHEVRSLGTVRELLSMARSGEGDLVISDVLLPDGSGLDALTRLREMRNDLPVIVMSAQNTFMTAVSAAERGAYEYLPKPFDIDELLGVVGRALASRAPSSAARIDGQEEMPLVGRSPAMQEVYRTLARVMQTDLTVLVTGESGTGKELVARALHDYGRRRNRAFVAVNMAAIPKELIEAELFGHEKGAFTGADARVAGRFEQAEGGTLFLDEIGDMPMEAQTRLLRVLQEREYTTVGGRRSRSTDVRIVAATNQDLLAGIEAGTFREDLYYRLNVVPLRLPSLRERRRDVPELCAHFLSRNPSEGLPSRLLDAKALEALQAHDWPGNVRELENVVRRLSVMSNDETISAGLVAQALDVGQIEPARAEASDFSSMVRRIVEEQLSQPNDASPLRLHDHMIARMEKPMIETVLASVGGNQLRAAEILGLNRNTLRKRVRELGITVRRGRRVGE